MFLKIVNKRDPLWEQVIVGKSGQDDGGWCTKEVGERYNIIVWKTIKYGRRLSKLNML